MDCDFIALATPGVQQLTPYRPGNAGTADVENLLMLASNENPLGTGELAQVALKKCLNQLEKYPDPVGTALKDAICRRFDVSADTVTLGNGSNDVLEIIARAFLDQDSDAIYSEYGFLVYPIVTKAAGAQGIEVPANAWGHDLDAMATAVTDRTKLIYLANPNNPTGTWFSANSLDQFMKKVPAHVIVVLDEAYAEFNDDDGLSGVDFFKQYSNLVVTRSFSKAHGLAGLRAGFALANVEITDLLNRVRQPFNMNALAIEAAAAALFDHQHLEASVKNNTQGMAQLEQGFSALGLSWIESKANFLTVDFGSRAQAVFLSLKEKGIMVRPLDNYRMPHHLRITIGTYDQNLRLLEGIESTLREVNDGS